MPFNRPHYATLDLSKEIIVLASGGRDSTAMALVLWAYLRDNNLSANVTLLCGDTFYNKRNARATLKELAAFTGFPLIWAKYDGEEKPGAILRKSFDAIPLALLIAKQNKTYKKIFVCCKKLKKDPMDNYLKQTNPDNTILVLGIKGGDSALHRRYRMRQLRDKGTFYRRHKSNNLNYFYPLRDCSNADISEVLTQFGFGKTQSSGCTLCPIFCVANWRKKDPDSHRRSHAFARSRGIKFEGLYQTDLKEFCSG